MSTATRLIAELEHDDPGVRAWAAEKLGQDRVQEAVPALLPLLSDPEARVCIAVLDALAEIGDPGAISAVCKTLSERRRSVGYAAERAVSAFGAQAIPALVEELRQGNWGLHSGATKALIAIGSPAVEALCQLLSSPVWQVRLDAVKALGYIGDREAVPGLVGALADENEWIRVQAVQVLHRLEDSRAVPALVAALKDTSKKVRLGAATALNDLGGTENEEALLQTLRDPDDAIRGQAAVTLGNVGTERSVLPLIGLLRDGNYAVVVALHLLAERAPCPALRAALPPLRQAVAHYQAGEICNDYLTLIERIESLTARFRDLPVPALPHAGSENLPRVNDLDAAPCNLLSDDRLACNGPPTRVMKWLRRIPMFRYEPGKR